MSKHSLAKAESSSVGESEGAAEGVEDMAEAVEDTEIELRRVVDVVVGVLVEEVLEVEVPRVEVSSVVKLGTETSLALLSEGTAAALSAGVEDTNPVELEKETAELEMRVASVAEDELEETALPMDELEGSVVPTDELEVSALPAAKVEETALPTDELEGSVVTDEPRDSKLTTEVVLSSVGAEIEVVKVEAGTELEVSVDSSKVVDSIAVSPVDVAMTEAEKVTVTVSGSAVDTTSASDTALSPGVTVKTELVVVFTYSLEVIVTI